MVESTTILQKTRQSQDLCLRLHMLASCRSSTVKELKGFRGEKCPDGFVPLQVTLVGKMMPREDDDVCRPKHCSGNKS